jgi:RimJ/RimL family protein N-acetyltransferase
MRIEGDGVVLVPDDPRFAADWARAFDEDPHLAVDFGVDVHVDEETARRWLTNHAELWAAGEGRHWAVLTQDDDFLGGVNYLNIRPEHHRAEIGFFLAPWARGRGVGTAAVGALCRWGFENWGLARIEMQTLPDNEGALGLARKLGFQREGLLRKRNHERGKQVDLVMLSLLAGELRGPSRE